MSKISLCTQVLHSRIIENKPTRIRVCLCLKGEINPQMGWFLSPFGFNTKLNHLINTAPTESFLQNQHQRLIDLLHKEFRPHNIQRVEIELDDLKSVYET